MSFLVSCIAPMGRIMTSNKRYSRKISFIRERWEAKKPVGAPHFFLFYSATEPVTVLYCSLCTCLEDQHPHSVKMSRFLIIVDKKATLVTLYYCLRLIFVHSNSDVLTSIILCIRSLWYMGSCFYSFMVTKTLYLANVSDYVLLAKLWSQNFPTISYISQNLRQPWFDTLVLSLICVPMFQSWPLRIEGEDMSDILV